MPSSSKFWIATAVGTYVLAIIASAGHGTLNQRLLQGLPAQQAHEVQQAFALAFMKGLRLSFTIAGLFVIAAGVIANRFVPSGAPQSDVEPSHDGFRRVPAGALSRAASGNGQARTSRRTAARR